MIYRTKTKIISQKIARFIIWICSKFIKDEVEQIIYGLIEVIKNRNPEVKPKDDFQEKHPNYRKFFVDPLAPLKKPLPPTPDIPTYDYKELLSKYELKHGKPLKPVNRQRSLPDIDCTCPVCNAPSEYLYWNDGKRLTQLRCKVCNSTFQSKKNLEELLVHLTSVHIVEMPYTDGR